MKDQKRRVERIEAQAGVSNVIPHWALQSVQVIAELMADILGEPMPSSNELEEMAKTLARKYQTKSAYDQAVATRAKSLRQEVAKLVKETTPEHLR